MPPSFIYAFCAIFGAMWGSFANVVIARWPLSLSIIYPASHCFNCRKPIKFYDNIPVLSYFILRGKCRNCGQKYSPSYFLVELAAALLSVAVMRVILSAYPVGIFAMTGYLIWFAFVLGLLTAAIIDFKTFLLPDAITLPGIAVGLFANIFIFKNGWMPYLIGSAGGYLVLSLLFVHGYRLLTGKTGMGEGDPKLVAMIGAFTGIHGVVFSLFAGSVLGVTLGSLLVVYRRTTGKGPAAPRPDEILDENGDEIDVDKRFRKAAVPFGPFLSIGALGYFFWGEAITEWYFDAFTSLINLF